MQRLVVIVRDHHAEIILGAERTHLVFDDGGKLKFFQSRPRVLMQSAHAGIGDRRRPAHALQLERPFAARQGLHDVLGVHWRLTEDPDDFAI